jgi:hypothetical protein
MKKHFRILTWGALLGVLLPVGTAGAQYVRMAPPPPVAQRPYQAPGRGYTWIPGYQRWDGRQYVWTGGRWVLPPRPRAVWQPGHWDRTPNGWRWFPGRWRG